MKSLSNRIEGKNKHKEIAMMWKTKVRRWSKDKVAWHPWFAWHPIDIKRYPDGSLENYG